MRYGPLGQSGLLVSVIGLGCNNFGGRLDVDGTRAVVDAAIDAGIAYPPATACSYSAAAFAPSTAEYETWGTSPPCW
jgi:aryl-alcohol dehydrogenase-like predicted oxidoreductase